MIGDTVAGTLPELRDQARSLMAESADVARLGSSGWSSVGSVPARRVKSGPGVVLPPGATGDAFVSRWVNVPHDADARAGDVLACAGERALVTTAARHTHMVELRTAGVWPAAPVRVTVTRPGTKDARGNPIPGTARTFTVDDVALFAVSSTDPTDLSMVVRTSMRAWCLPGVTLLPGDELIPANAAMPYRYIVKGDPAYSPLGVVADLVRGQVVGNV